MEKLKQGFFKFEDFIFKIANIYILLLILILIFTVTIQVLSRYVFRNSPVWTVEVTRMALVWMVFIGSAIALRLGMHMNIELLHSNVHNTVRLILDIIIHLSIFIFIGVLIYHGGTLTLETRTSPSEALRLPYSYIYVCLPVSGVLMLICTIGKLLRGGKSIQGKGADGV